MFVPESDASLQSDGLYRSDYMSNYCSQHTSKKGSREELNMGLPKA